MIQSVAQPTALATSISPAHNAALKMAALGIPVFPLHGITEDGNCTCGAASGNCSAGKHPRRMPSFKEATTQASIINIWFKEQDINYGVRTGVEINSTGKMLVVIDIDSYKDGCAEAWEFLLQTHGPLPDTAEVHSGAGGRHLYFLTDMGVSFTDKLCANVDFKVNGYVVGPGSMHASGKRYEWEGSSDLFEGQEIAELPNWTVELARKPAIREREPSAEPKGGATLTDSDMLSIKADLADIPADDYNVWIEVLMALKSLRADHLTFELAADWSSKSKKYDASQFGAKWQSITADGGIGIGTINRLANKERTMGVDISKLLARLSAGLDTAEFGGMPKPLSDVGVAEAYPLNALPLVIRDSVIEVQEFVQAPMAMVACSALATLSLAAQGLYDVERAPSLSGPVGLYFMTVADSGERKSSLDNYFSKPIATYEQEQAKAALPLMDIYNADLTIWDAKKNGLSDAIKQAAKGGKSDTLIEVSAQMRAHEADKPARPAIPRLIYSDTTPEALARGIATEWASAGLVVSEGGTFFGGHAMGKESQMRNMALINKLWDGTPARIDRTTAPSFTVEGRLTVAIQVQAPTLKAFFSSAGDLPRGTGFMARFLVAWPESTQGTRLFRNSPVTWPALDRFHARITDILNSPQPIQDGRLRPPKLYLSSAAKAVWTRFFDELEVQLGAGGKLHNIRDVASKTADNAARLAALFHIIDGGSCSGSISEEHMSGATQIVYWHLKESQRLLNDTTVPTWMAHAEKLDVWLRDKCDAQATTQFTVTQLLQSGPGSLRKKDVLDAALGVLASLKRIKIVDGSPCIIKVNPALLAAD